MAEWKEDGKLKLLIIVGTRPEIIRLAAVIKKCRTYFDTLLAHTGQNYDYTLNGVFFKDLGLADMVDVAGYCNYGKPPMTILYLFTGLTIAIARENRKQKKALREAGTPETPA